MELLGKTWVNRDGIGVSMAMVVPANHAKMRATLYSVSGQAGTSRNKGGFFGTISLAYTQRHGGEELNTSVWICRSLILTHLDVPRHGGTPKNGWFPLGAEFRSNQIQMFEFKQAGRHFHGEFLEA